ncbi:hypothetical protein AHF37_02157 [Paragonimus kellicotti]|nr:hypothetical protein AHF37_02157 [Paragonimus kellicotti]
MMTPAKRSDLMFAVIDSDSSCSADELTPLNKLTPQFPPPDFFSSMPSPSDLTDTIAVRKDRMRGGRSRRGRTSYNNSNNSDVGSTPPTELPNFSGFPFTKDVDESLNICAVTCPTTNAVRQSNSSHPLSITTTAPTFFAASSSETRSTSRPHATNVLPPEFLSGLSTSAFLQKYHLEDVKSAPVGVLSNDRLHSEQLHRTTFTGLGSHLPPVCSPDLTSSQHLKNTLATGSTIRSTVALTNSGPTSSDPCWTSTAMVIAAAVAVASASTSLTQGSACVTGNRSPSPRIKFVDRLDPDLSDEFV